MLPWHAVVRRDCVEIAMRRSRSSRGRPPHPSTTDDEKRHHTPPRARRHPAREGEGTNKFHRQNRGGKGAGGGKARQGKAMQASRCLMRITIVGKERKASKKSCRGNPCATWDEGKEAAVGPALVPLLRAWPGAEKEGTLGLELKLSRARSRFDTAHFLPTLPHS